MITGIEVLKFGVEDKAEAIKFLSDFGLVQQPSDISEAELFQTQNGSKIYLFDLHDSRLPVAIEDGSTLREVTWGVDSDQDLQQFAQNLKDIEGFEQGTEYVQCRDPNGMTIVFKRSITKDLPEQKTEGINQYGNIQRVNAASPVYEKGEPIAIEIGRAHV